jgi:hypothetical protein
MRTWDVIVVTKPASFIPRLPALLHFNSQVSSLRGIDQRDQSSVGFKHRSESKPLSSLRASHTPPRFSI